MKVIFTPTFLKYPAAGGQFLRMENSVKALHAVAEVHILSRLANETIGGDGAEAFYKKYCTKFMYTPSVDNSFLNRVSRKIKFFIHTYLQKRTNSHFPLAVDVDFILHYANKEKIDVIWCGYGCRAFDFVAMLKLRAPHLKIIYDTDSVHSRFVLRELEFEPSEVRRKQIERDGLKEQRDEIISVNLCDAATAVSEVDAEYYRKIALSPEKVHLFSNVIDLNNYDLPCERPEDLPRGKIIYLSGSFGPKSPMEFAARWFIDTVFPLLEKESNVYLLIVGNGADVVLKDVKHERIIIKGMQKTLLPYLKHADVAIVPLWFESGTRFKIIEAAACNIPIVSTSLGAEGLPVKDGEHIFIADTPEDFASAITKVFGQSEGLSRMVAANRKLIEAHCTLAALMDEGKNILSYVAAKKS